MYYLNFFIRIFVYSWENISTILNIQFLTRFLELIVEIKALPRACSN